MPNTTHLLRKERALLGVDLDELGLYVSGGQLGQVVIHDLGPRDVSVNSDVLTEMGCFNQT